MDESRLRGIRAAVVCGCLRADDALSHAKRSYELSRAGELAAAETEMREAIRLEPANPLYHSALAGVLQKIERTSDAVAEWESTLSLRPSEPARSRILQVFEEAVLESGAKLGAGGKFREGLLLATRAERQFPQSERTLLMLAFFESKQRLNSDAVKTYQRAVKVNPASAEGVLGLGVAQAACGLEREAIKTLGAARQAHPEDARFPQALGDLLMARPDQSASDVAEARALFESALAINPKLAESHYQLGVLANRNGRADEARRDWEEAAKLSPADARVHFALARLHRLSNRPEDAKREMALFAQTRDSSDRQ